MPSTIDLNGVLKLHGVSFSYTCDTCVCVRERVRVHRASRACVHVRICVTSWCHFMDAPHTLPKRSKHYVAAQKATRCAFGQDVAAQKATDIHIYVRRRRRRLVSSSYSRTAINLNSNNKKNTNDTMHAHNTYMRIPTCACACVTTYIACARVSMHACVLVSAFSICQPLAWLNHEFIQTHVKAGPRPHAPCYSC